MRYIHEYWSSVEGQSYHFPATAMASAIVKEADRQGADIGLGGKITVTSNVEVGGVPAGTSFDDAKIADVITKILTKDLASSINITYSPTTVMESGTTKTFTFTTTPTSGSSPIVKQVVTFDDGTTKTFENGTSNSFTKEMTIVSQEKVKIVATEEDGDTVSKEIKINAYLPMFSGTSLVQQFDEEGNPIPESATAELILGLTKKLSKSGYKGSVDISFTTGNQWFWFAVPADQPITSVISENFPVPMADAQDLVLEINGVNQNYKIYRGESATQNIQTPFTQTYILN